jgi:hypothetical protein
MIFIIIIFLFYDKEYFETETEIPITFHSFWGDVNNDLTIVNLFRSILPSKNYNEIQVYSVFGGGPSIKDPNVLYVQFSGERHYHDPQAFDINFIPAIPDDTNKVVVFPYAAFQTLINAVSPEYNIRRFLEPRQYQNPEKFCLFAVGNSSCSQRNNFFQELSTYKKVDSCGYHMNNLGMSCPGGHSSPEYLDFISHYKFMICFENSSQPNYYTEKLMNAYYGGTIPIYWGDPLIFDKVNPEAILYLKTEFTKDDVNALINEIRRLDNDHDAYRKKHACPLFRNGQLPDCFNVDKIRQLVEMKIS